MSHQIRLHCMLVTIGGKDFCYCAVPGEKFRTIDEWNKWIRILNYNNELVLMKKTRITI